MRAYSKRHLTGLLLHPVNVLIVYHNPVVDRQNGAIIGLGEESVLTTDLDVDVSRDLDSKVIVDGDSSPHHSTCLHWEVDVADSGSGGWGQPSLGKGFWCRLRGVRIHDTHVENTRRSRREGAGWNDL